MTAPLLDWPETLYTDLGRLSGLVEALTFQFLERSPHPFASPGPLLGAASHLNWQRLRGTRRREGAALRLPASLLEGAVRSGRPLAWRVLSDGGETSVEVGRPQGLTALFFRALNAFCDGPAPETGLSLDISRPWTFGCLHGHPQSTPAFRRAVEPPALLDRILDAAAGKPFFYLVYATPYPADRTRDHLARMRAAAEEVDRIHLKVGEQSDLDRTALLARRLLDATASRLEEGLARGLWRATLVVGAEDPDVVEQSLGTLVGGFRGPLPLGERAEGGVDAEPPPPQVQAYRCLTDDSGWSPHCNVFTTEELATTCLLPGRDRVGYFIRVDADFDVDHNARSTGLVLGSVLDGTLDTGRPFRVDDLTLCRHALVAGQTGSGKSTTVRALLGHVGRRGLPFLVLDPVKPVHSEYATLAREVPALCVFQVGLPPQAGQIPFQLNPFSFPAGYPLFTHVDFLKATFMAAFGLWSPLPFLLETAIYRTYEKRGWDMATGLHRAGHDALAMPTLMDLLDEIDPVVEAAGYGDEIARNVKGALHSRISNLCLGPKGLVLNTRSEIPERLLLETPLVLGLMSFGSTQEQAFVMGLVLTRLLEARQVQGLPEKEALRHLVVLEEAHRLLKRTQEKSAEESNMAHQAVETFSNLIAEIRAYGQGFVVVEQIPSNLATNVVKQTTLKVIHRLTPKDDRDLVGDAMILEPDQKRALATLPIGEAVAMADGMDGAVRIRVQRLPSRQGDPPQWDRRVRKVLKTSEEERLDAQVERMLLSGLLHHPDLKREADGVFTRCLLRLPARDALVPLQRTIRRLQEVTGQSLAAADLDNRVGLALQDAWLRRALVFGLTEASWEKARRKLAQKPAVFLDTFHSVSFRPTGPYPWCDECPAPCRFPWEGATLGATAEVGLSVDDVLDGTRKDVGTCLAEGVRAALDTHVGGGATLKATPHVGRSGTGDMEAGLTWCVVGHGLQRRALSVAYIRDWLGAL